MICSSSKPPFIIYFQGNVLNSKKSKKKSQVVNLHLSNKNPKFSQQKVSGHSAPLQLPKGSKDGPMITSMTPSCGSSVNSTVPQIALLAASCTVKRLAGNVGEMNFGTRKRWYILLYIYIYMWYVNIYIYIYTCIYIYMCNMWMYIYIYIYMYI